MEQLWSLYDKKNTIKEISIDHMKNGETGQRFVLNIILIYK